MALPPSRLLHRTVNMLGHQLRCDSAAQLLAAVRQSRRLYLAPAELLGRRKRGRFFSGPAGARLSLLELPEESGRGLGWVFGSDLCFGFACGLREIPLEVNWSRLAAQGWAAKPRRSSISYGACRAAKLRSSIRSWWLHTLSPPLEAALRQSPRRLSRRARTRGPRAQGGLSTRGLSGRYTNRRQPPTVRILSNELSNNCRRRRDTALGLCGRSGDLCCDEPVQRHTAQGGPPGSPQLSTLAATHCHRAGRPCGGAVALPRPGVLSATGEPKGRLRERRQPRVGGRAARTSASHVQQLGSSGDLRLAHELEPRQRGSRVKIMRCRLVRRLGGLQPLGRLLDGVLVCSAAARWDRHASLVCSAARCGGTGMPPWCAVLRCGGTDWGRVAYACARSARCTSWE